MLQKTDSSLLLEIEAALHRAAHIDEQAEMQRQVGFAAKVYDRLRRLVIVEDGEVGLVQIAHKFAVLVGRDKKNIHFIHALVDGEQGSHLRVIVTRWVPRGG